MNEKEKKFGFKWLKKIKNIKHIEIYIAVIFVVVVLLIYMSSTKTKTNSKTITQEENELTVTAYVDKLEHNLADILTNIGGVSNVKVMITLNMNQAEVNESKINLSKFPDVKGIVVTGKGLSNTATKLKVLHAIEAVIDITSGNIEILSSD